ncbi:MAG: RNA-binding protein [Candidatus Kapaibacterium sp.]
MPNKTLFQTLKGKLLPKTTTRNNENAPAYEFTPKHQLAQLAATGCISNTFYVQAENQLENVLALGAQLDAEFVAKTAVYAREKGYMKDMPALLLAMLTVKDVDLLKRTFPRVANNGKMLRNYVQIIRSGAVGRKSFGSAPKRLLQDWFESRTDRQVFTASIGQTPSMADVIKMVRPKPQSKSREALYGYLIGKEYNQGLLPEIVQQFEAFKRDRTSPVPDVPFEMLTALNLGTAEWVEIAKNASWQTTRMNVNTFARHGVFNTTGMTEVVAQRLRNEQEIRKARVFPYQLLVAYINADSTIPYEIREALQDALEIATSNIPVMEGKVVVATDVSGSMQSPVTGYRQGATTKVRCIDVAALVSASIMRVNKQARIIPFENDVVNVQLNSRDSVITNAQKLAAVGGGGTNCSAPLAKLNKERATVDVVIYVSDNESWVDANRTWGYSNGTAVMREWETLKQRNPQAKLINIDITPNSTTQAKDRNDILNIGGFSDNVFTTIAQFISKGNDAELWVKEIEAIEL